MPENAISLEKEECCGCKVCEKVCPKHAITIKPDEVGFWYPVIDENLCVDCGLCKKKCAFQSGYKKRKEYKPFYGYGCRHKEESVYMNSRSGGAFVAMSDIILAEDGVIYGAGYDPEKGVSRVIHKRAVNAEERDEFCKSKYVQSDLGNTFESIKADLEAGKTVLFSGTGCQVGALYSYLPKEYDNLYSIDIVCHGVPSPKMWADFVELREQESGGKAAKADFRNKNKFGWLKQTETLWINGKACNSKVYSRLFKMTCYRPSCHNCKYTNKNRVGDITIADFWGHEDALKELWDDDKGISLVLVNNAKGMKLWEKARESMDWVDCTGYPFRHSNMKHPTKKNEQYDEFYKDYAEKGLEYVVEKYCDYKFNIPKEESKKAEPKINGSETAGPEKNASGGVGRLFKKLLGKS